MTEEAEQRARVVAEAHSWLGTPYVHGGRLKGIGADCTFVADVYHNAGLIPYVEIEPYSPQAHLHRTGGTYVDTVRSYARETQEPLPGDLAMYWIGRDFSHGAIIVDPGWPTIIHADINAHFIILDLGDRGPLTLAKKRVYFTFVGGR